MTTYPVPVAEMRERYLKLYSGAVNDILRFDYRMHAALPSGFSENVTILEDGSLDLEGLYITIYYNAHDIFANASFKSWDPFGIETGLSAQTTFNNGISLSIEYSLSIRQDFHSHTGLIKIDYKF